MSTSESTRKRDRDDDSEQDSNLHHSAKKRRLNEHTAFQTITAKKLFSTSNTKSAPHKSKESNASIHNNLIQSDCNTINIASNNNNILDHKNELIKQLKTENSHLLTQNSHLSTSNINKGKDIDKFRNLNNKYCEFVQKKHPNHSLINESNKLELTICKRNLENEIKDKKDNKNDANNVLLNMIESEKKKLQNKSEIKKNNNTIKNDNINEMINDFKDNINKKSNLQTFLLCIDSKYIDQTKELNVENNEIMLLFPKNMNARMKFLFEKEGKIIDECIGKIEKIYTASKRNQTRNSNRNNNKKNEETKFNKWKLSMKHGINIETLWMGKSPMNKQKFDTSKSIKQFQEKHGIILVIWKDPQNAGYRINRNKTASKHTNMLYFGIIGINGNANI